MKANRLSKDESGADSSDAIIILALILGLLLVLVYIGHSVSDWLDQISLGFGEWLSGLIPNWSVFNEEPISPEELFGDRTGTSEAVNATDKTDDLLESIFVKNNFLLTSESGTSQYDAYLIYTENQTIDNKTNEIRRWSVKVHEEQSNIAKIREGDISRNVVKIPDELMKKMEDLREGRTIVITGNEYKGEITANLLNRNTNKMEYAIEVVKLGT